jgi:hypothetical protein
MYEVAVRFENLQLDSALDFDGNAAADPIDSDILRIGINRYSAGHNLKWTLQYSMVDSTVSLSSVGADADVSPDDEIALGLTLAF